MQSSNYVILGHLVNDDWQMMNPTILQFSTNNYKEFVLVDWIGELNSIAIAFLVAELQVRAQRVTDKKF